jgi:hypothetical protein
MAIHDDTGREIYAADGTTIIGYRGLNNTAGIVYSNNANCFLISIKDQSGTPIVPDLRITDDAASEAVELIIKETTPLAYYVTDSAAGTIMGIFDITMSVEGVQSMIRGLGPNAGDLVGTITGGHAGIDVSGTTVTAATAISFT